jgi:hypothetical protein
LHEEFAREYEVEGANNKRFGLVVGGILALFACLRIYLHSELGSVAIILGIAGFGLMGAAVVFPDRLTPLNRAWARLGLLLHKVTNPLFLAVMYFLAIIPTGLMMRAFGVDPMARRIDKNGNYWVKRSNGSSTAESLGQPF